LYNLDPNVGGGVGAKERFPEWPEWDEDGKLMWFLNGENKELHDDFRSESYAFLKGNFGSLRV
jgi:hypothetical protein